MHSLQQTAPLFGLCLIFPSTYNVINQHTNTLQWKHKRIPSEEPVLQWDPCIPRARTLTYVAVVHPDALPIVAAPAFHHVVRVIRFSNLIVWVDDNLGREGGT